MGDPHSSSGPCYEDLEVGAVIRHLLGRTITSTDNRWFTLLTMNTNPIHFDVFYSAQTEFGKPAGELDIHVSVGHWIVGGGYFSLRGEPGLG
jgi:acyl dehydratase